MACSWQGSAWGTDSFFKKLWAVGLIQTATENLSQCIFRDRETLWLWLGVLEAGSNSLATYGKTCGTIETWVWGGHVVDYTDQFLHHHLQIRLIVPVRSYQWPEVFFLCQVVLQKSTLKSHLTFRDRNPIVRVLEVMRRIIIDIVLESIQSCRSGSI